MKTYGSNIKSHIVKKLIKEDCRKTNRSLTKQAIIKFQKDGTDIVLLKYKRTGDIWYYD